MTTSSTTPPARANDVQKSSVVRKGAITGVAVICEMLSGGLFMENVKMEKQRTSHPYPTIMSRTLRQGLTGFWAGFWPWGFTLGMAKGIVLGSARAGFLNLYLDMGMTPGQADVISGFCAGGVQGIFMAPILLARTRVNEHISNLPQTGKSQTTFLGEMGISMRILNAAIRNEGIGVLTIGMPTMIMKRTLDWGTRFVFMREIRNFYRERKGDPNEPFTKFEKLMSAFLGGSLSVFITMPVDRLMPIIQEGARNKEKTIVMVMRERFQREGVTTLFRGGVMRTIHCGWHTGFAIFAAGQIYDMIDKKL